jgi:glycosyltransferase involved in cell wall biosynthesis
MVTAEGRFETLKRSYQCYLDQTYPNRELLILTDGSDEYKWNISKLVEGRDDVRKIYLKAKKGEYTLGGLRNIAVGCCTGDLWMQWDDDDFNAPERIAVQYSFLARRPNAMLCFLGDQLHYYFDKKILYWNNWWWYQSGGMKKYGLIPGTIMAYKKNFPYKYPSSGQFARAAEDSVLTNWMCDNMPSSVEILTEFGYLYMYSFHGKNVWDVEHHINISMNRSLYIDYMIKHRERICRTLKYLNLADEVQVMGRDGLAFTYRCGE